MTIAFYDASQVEELLDYPGCIDAMRRAMTALSSGERPQPLRQIFTVGNNDMFGTMPGELAALSTFGAKLVSVYGDPGLDVVNVMLMFDTRSSVASKVKPPDTALPSVRLS